MKLPPIPVRHIPDNAASFSFIQEGPWGLPDPNAQLAALLEMPRDELQEASKILTYLLTQAGLLERLLDVAIAVLDVRQGEIDLEDNNDQEGIDEREEDNSDREPDDEDADEYCDDEEDDAPEDDDPAESEITQGIGGAGYRWVTTEGPTENTVIPERAPTSPLFGRNGR